MEWLDLEERTANPQALTLWIASALYFLQYAGFEPGATGRPPAAEVTRLKMVQHLNKTRDMRRAIGYRLD